MLLKGCFNFKTKVLVFDFDKIVYIYENNYPIPNNRGGGKKMKGVSKLFSVRSGNQF